MVLLSVAGHGALLAWADPRADPARRAGGEPAAAARKSCPSTELVAHPELITFEELERLRAAGAPVLLLDVRTERGYEASPLQAVGAIRPDADRPVESAASLALPREAWLVAYCA